MGSQQRRTDVVDERFPDKARQVLGLARRLMGLADAAMDVYRRGVVMTREGRPDLVEAGLRRIHRDPPQVPTWPEPGFGVAA